MNEEFLTGLGLDSEVAGRILGEYEAERLREDLGRRLAAEGAVDCEAAAAMLDTDGMTAENIAERIDALKAKHSALFAKANAPKMVSSAQADTTARSDFEKMGYRERLALFKKNPEQYKKLVM